MNNYSSLDRVFGSFGFDIASRCHQFTKLHLQIMRKQADEQQRKEKEEEAAFEAEERQLQEKAVQSQAQPEQSKPANAPSFDSIPPNSELKDRE
jgi:hypothetical protein